MINSLVFVILFLSLIVGMILYPKIRIEYMQSEYFRLYL